jgi:hypothetical protein
MIVKMLNFIFSSGANMLSAVFFSVSRFLLYFTVLFFALMMLPYWLYTTHKNIEASFRRFFKAGPVEKPNSLKS